MLNPRTLILILLFSACAGVACGAEVAVCTDPGDQVGPDVYGNYVAWEDHRGTSPRIYLYDISAGTAAVIEPPSLTSSQYEPEIYGDHVVYVSHSKAGYEVRLYSISAGTSEIIRTSDQLLERPDVYSALGGVAVVWTEYRQDDPYGAANSDIYLYTRSTSLPGLPQTARVSDGGYETDPRISGRDIVWMHKAEVPGLDSYHGPYDVYAKIGSGTPLLVSTGTDGERNLFPDVSSGRVVWQAHPETDGYGARVLSSDLTPTVTDPVTLRPHASETPAPTEVCGQPAISGDTVVYVRSDLGAGGDRLRVTDPGSDLDYGLSESTHVASPRIARDVVVWQDRRAGNWDIYLASAGPIPVSGCTVIEEPGYYVLTADIVDSACPVAISIGCSDVLLDGRGHLVDGQDAAGTGGIMIFGETPDPWQVDALTNVNVRNVRLTDWQQGVFSALCSNSLFSGISMSSGVDGIGLQYCESNALISSSVRDNSGDGLRIVDYSSLDLTGCTIERNGGNGVFGYLSGVHCRDSVIAENGADGFNFDRAAGTLHNCTIRDNAEAGIEFYHVESATITIEGNTITGNAIGISDLNGYGSGRKIYNNHFNNTVNTDSTASTAWSVAAAPGPNIIGGPSIGGNYWARPNGKGFSQIHADLDHDGFCDEEYTIVQGDGDWPPASIDYLPLKRIKPVVSFPGHITVPLDLDLNGKYEDINGNARKDFADVVLYFNQMSWIGENQPIEAFDYNLNNRIDFADVVWLFGHL